MKIVLLVVGKTVESYFKEAVQEYVKRIGYYLPFELVILPDLKNTKNLTQEIICQKEGEGILKQIQSGDHVVLLDEKGKSYTSRQFAGYIERQQHRMSKRLLFVIGGAYGFSPQVYDMVRQRLSLSEMTFSHQMVRLVFVEQLYRAMTILAGEPYHHD